MRPPFRVFAYGSNMSVSRLRERTPSAEVRATGRLGGHDLRWHKRGRDGSGKCDALHTGRPSDGVWGVLFDIDPSERPALDAAESLGIGYAEKRLPVWTATGPVIASLYVATLIDGGLAPFHWYKRHVLAGAREHGLPADYVARIEQVPALHDPDRQRAARNERLYRPS